MSQLLFALIVAIACQTLSAQPTAAARSAFDAVSIRPSDSTDAGSALVAQAGSVAIRNATLRRIVAMLYDVDDRQIAGGPLWIDDEPFDIVATGRPSLSRDELIRMTKAMLADRFKLAMRSEMRELPVYELTTARSDRQFGSGLKKTAGSCRGAGSAGRAACATPVTPGTIVSTGTTIKVFAANHLAPLLDRLVVDRTGLAGSFDVVLRVDPQFARASDTASTPPALLAAVEEQLGLSLRATSGSVPVLVVDRVERPVN